MAILAPDFAPSSLPPALRIRLFTRHLPEFGWEPIVISTDSAYYDWPIDPENQKVLADGLRVIRTKALPIELTRLVGIGDIGLRSLWHTWWALSRLCWSERVDLLFVSIPPNVTAVLARLAHLRFGIPYVVDYIDPWVSDYYLSVPRDRRPGGAKWTLAHRLGKALEPVAMRRVAHLTAVSSATTQGAFDRYLWLKDVSVSEIPYGGEPSDFEHVRNNHRPNPIFDPHDGLLHVCYLGTCSQGMRRPLAALFMAVRREADAQPDLYGRLRFHFVGTTYAPRPEGQYQVLPLAEEAGVRRYVEEHPGRISYFGAAQVLVDSHALVVVGSEEPHYTASKLYPYILSRRPLLAIFHRMSSVVGVLEETQAGEVVVFDDHVLVDSLVEEIARHFTRLLLLPSDHVPATRWKQFERYTAHSMAGRLASAFEQAMNVNKAGKVEESH